MSKISHTVKRLEFTRHTGTLLHEYRKVYPQSIDQTFLDEYVFLPPSDLHWRHAVRAGVFVQWPFDVLPGDQSYPCSAHDTGCGQEYG